VKIEAYKGEVKDYESFKTKWKENKRIRELYINRSSMPRTEIAIEQQ
jgi:hypothetical protein